MRTWVLAIAIIGFTVACLAVAVAPRRLKDHWNRSLPGHTRQEIREMGDRLGRPVTDANNFPDYIPER